MSKNKNSRHCAYVSHCILKLDFVIWSLKRLTWLSQPSQHFLSHLFFFPHFLGTRCNSWAISVTLLCSFSIESSCNIHSTFCYKGLLTMNDLCYWAGEPGKGPNKRCAFVLHKSKVSLCILEIFKAKDLTVGVLCFSNILTPGLGILSGQVYKQPSGKLYHKGSIHSFFSLNLKHNYVYEKTIRKTQLNINNITQWMVAFEVIFFSSLL